MHKAIAITKKSFIQSGLQMMMQKKQNFSFSSDNLDRNGLYIPPNVEKTRFDSTPSGGLDRNLRAISCNFAHFSFNHQ